MLEEIFTRYEFDAFCLDYCRFAGAQCDFSPATREAFEDYLGEKLERFPEDVFSYDADGARVPGKYYKQWWTFRSMAIRDFISEIRDLRDRVAPEVKLHYWAASWLHAIYVNGQNWGSPKAEYYKDYEYDWATMVKPVLPTFSMFSSPGPILSAFGEPTTRNPLNMA